MYSITFSLLQPAALLQGMTHGNYSGHKDDRMKATKDSMDEEKNDRENTGLSFERSKLRN